ncbi:MAG TPA: hypothetical protein PLC79_08520, partial [Phycisphaerae bacterium]|nr:hypothetical protein [Phycisphaerae bacterium]
REALLFGIPFVVFWAGHSLFGWWFSSRGRRRGAAAFAQPGPIVSRRANEALLAYEQFPLPTMPLPRSGAAKRPAGTGGESATRYRRVVWAGRAVTVAILLSAAALHYLRDVRNRDLAQAFTLLRQHDYTRALATVERAERWPYVAGPGRIEYAKALCYEGLGDRDQAEAWFLASVRADPSYFWPLADLIEFYVSGREPLAERRRRAEPYLKRMRNRFAWHYRQAQFLERIERALADPPPRARSATRGPATKPGAGAPLRR